MFYNIQVDSQLGQINLSTNANYFKGILMLISTIFACFHYFIDVIISFTITFILQLAIIYTFMHSGEKLNLREAIVINICHS